MRLPHNLIERLTLVAGSPAELCAALGESIAVGEPAEIERLHAAGLPPVTSLGSLSVMTGYNPGFVWALLNRTEKYYRVFYIQKGRHRRQIEAPRVSLKLIQKWLGYHFAAKWQPLNEVHGFVPGRSHLTAASEHLRAQWIVSLDLENFFPSTPTGEIRHSLLELGYRERDSLDILVKLLSYEDRLSQGAPTSPVIANIALAKIDKSLSAISKELGIRFTRYADDITFSGLERLANANDIINRVIELLAGTPWRIANQKIHVAESPDRLKVHGLLVHGDKIRLTKGYRNRLRAYRHLLGTGRISDDDLARIKGHLNYGDQVEKSNS